MIHLKSELSIPIYDSTLWVVVADNIQAARATLNDVFGPLPGGGYNGLCSWDESCTFGLFFTTGSCRSIGVVSHEVFHLTNRIMESVNSPFNVHRHEQGALLHGYLMRLVMGAISEIKTEDQKRR